MISAIYNISAPDFRAHHLIALRFLSDPKRFRCHAIYFGGSAYRRSPQKITLPPPKTMDPTLYRERWIIFRLRCISELSHDSSKPFLRCDVWIRTRYGSGPIWIRIHVRSHPDSRPLEQYRCDLPPLLIIVNTCICGFSLPEQRPIVLIKAYMAQQLCLLRFFVPRASVLLLLAPAAPRIFPYWHQWQSVSNNIPLCYWWQYSFAFSSFDINGKGMHTNSPCQAAPPILLHIYE